MTGKSGSNREKSRALDKDLKAMFRSLEKRPVPQRLQSVADQLAHDAVAPPAKKAG